MRCNALLRSGIIIIMLSVVFVLLAPVPNISAQSEYDTPSQSDKAEKGDAAFWVFIKIFGPIMLVIALVGVIATKAMSQYGHSKYLDHHYVHEIMSKEFFFVEEEKTLLETHWIFERKKVDDLLVVRDPMILCGIIYRADVDALDPTTLADKKVSDLAKQPLASISPHDPISKAVELLAARKCAYLPVLESGRVVGVATVSAVEKIVRDKAPKQ